jgi:hypothetical protein
MLASHLVQLFPRLALLAVLLGLLPPASTPASLASVARLAATQLATAPAATPPSSGPIARPSDARSSGLPASSAAGFRDQFESQHTLNGLFAGRFSTPRALAYVEPGPFHLSDPDNPQMTFVIPAGKYDSLEVDAWARSYHWFWGVDASIAVRPLGTTTWYGIGVFSVGGHRLCPQWRFRQPADHPRLARATPNPARSSSQLRGL